MMESPPKRVLCLKALVFASLATVSGCNGGTDPELGSLRFGQLGEIRIQLSVPLRLGEGELQQSLTWNSSGPWQLAERISYLKVLGDEQVRVSTGDPDLLAGAYASLITQINETQGLKLFIDELDPTLSPQCGAGRTRIIFRIHDARRNETVAWNRCMLGTFGTLIPSSAGPEPQAVRVVQAARLARDATLGTNFVSSYQGSVPFATLDRGEDSNAALTTPLSIVTADALVAFWGAHKPGEIAPDIDFEKDQVIVGAVGLRPEAGDSVEVRRILQLDGGSVTHVFERIPGDFCSPAAREQFPFHIVVAPRTEPPMSFAEVQVERVACGR